LELGSKETIALKSEGSEKRYHFNAFEEPSMKKMFTVEVDEASECVELNLNREGVIF
jgi:hypothetical protein